MNEPKRDLSASVLARLLNRAKQAGDEYQAVLAGFCFERFLYRLGQSPVRDRFVLKGAMLLRLWMDTPYRATRDLDLLRKGVGTSEAILSDIQGVCEMKVEPDGVSFDPGSIRLEAIRGEDEYGGTRVLLTARCGTARLPLQVDLGLGDAVWPAPKTCTYPSLLDFPAPRILAYPREAAIAEKMEAIIVLGDRNSRIKDFFDLYHLAKLFEFDRVTLGEAMRKTFVRRRTPLPVEDPIGLTSVYWRNNSRPPQVVAFARRAHLSVGPDPGAEILPLLRSFLVPILDDLRTSKPHRGTWPPGGPWR